MPKVSTYPSDEKDLNLKCINTLKNKYCLPVGYSGYELTVSTSIITASLGAAPIEIQITFVG